MTGDLSPQRRGRIDVTPLAGGRYEVAVLAFDYFAELSLVCGVLAAHRLDIEWGRVRTLDVEGERGPVRRAVDVFRVRPLDGAAPSAEALERDLLELLDLAAAGQGVAARERLNVRLVEALPAAPAAAGGVIEIAFDEAPEAEWTVMDVRGPDAPGFLYAVTSALALRGVYVHEVQVEGGGGAVHDRFLLGRRDGGKLGGGAEEEEALRRAVVLIRQFTALLPAAPDPARALRYFDQLLDQTRALDAATLAAFATPEGLTDLARVLGSSAFLWEDRLRGRAGRFLPLLAGWRQRPPRGRQEHASVLRARLAAAGQGRWPEVVEEFRAEETLLLETRRLLDPTFGLEDFAHALTALAEALVGEAVRALEAALGEEHGHPVSPAGAPCRLAVCALGKFGGAEMGYASDLELVFFYSGPGACLHSGRPAGWFYDELVRAVSSLLAAPEQGLFHLDLRLRPHGSKGPLSCPLDAARDYYRVDGAAAPFERQALVKLRAVAGDAALGAEVLGLRDAFVWSGAPWDGADAVRLRLRQAQELVPRGRFNVKLSRGGLVDAEYTAQYLQVQHGAARPGLRTPSTLQALDALRGEGLLDEDEHRDLRAGYLFWRGVSDALRMLRGQAGDLLLPDEGSDDYGFLARRLGYAGGRRDAAARLAADVARHRARLAALYDARFTPAGRP